MQQCEIAVNLMVSKEAYKVLEQIASQNTAVFIEINPDGTVTLAARMFDYTEPSGDWEDFEWDTLE